MSVGMFIIRRLPIRSADGLLRYHFEMRLLLILNMACSGPETEGELVTHAARGYALGLILEE